MYKGLGKLNKNKHNKIIVLGIYTTKPHRYEGVFAF